MNRKSLFIVLFCAIILVVSIPAFILRPERQALYKVTYLPSPGKEFFLPCSINDKGQIAGFAKVAYRSYHLFLWDREKGLQDLGPVVNHDVFINNAGQIAATMQDPNGHYRAFIWDPNHGRRILPTLRGKPATVHNDMNTRGMTEAVHGINNHGQVVGQAKMASGVSHACVWDANSEIHDLTPSSKQHTAAWSINDTGQVVVFAPGARLLVDVNKNRTSTPQPIPLGGLIEINNNGYIAGMIQAGPGKYDIVVWHSDSGQKKLVQLNANASSDMTINDVNQVLLTKGRRPKFRLFGRNFFSTHVENYLHDPKRGWISINKYVDIGPHEDLCATDLNNKGCIVGAIQSTKDSRSRGVLLEPIPEQWDKR
jgi:probable HAF family extracellular repeat protein